jgi:small basic protein
VFAARIVTRYWAKEVPLMRSHLSAFAYLNMVSVLSGAAAYHYPIFKPLTILSSMASGVILGTSLSFYESKKLGIVIYTACLAMTMTIYFGILQNPEFLRYIWKNGLTDSYFILSAWKFALDAYIQPIDPRTVKLNSSDTYFVLVMSSVWQTFLFAVSLSSF